eukprot:gnl/TRDRNA2_/TRDRNA2_170859_c0_seq1.p1 gnl/TRDRNA2_/TRDRNA2_170859_c0~~gnl/TRDRNA2_/TRDRNA2_170859_c0_seq1.p1  ORF type:complete len:854 (+),score=139.14 gnl/TRDRNA2_/TRDRNA2_170859_c0_seq1:134-2563(+)
MEDWDANDMEDCIDEAEKTMRHMLTTSMEKEAKRIVFDQAAAAALDHMMIHDFEGAVREVAAQALGFMGEKALAQVPSLSVAMRDKQMRVRLAAAAAIGQVVGPAAKKAAAAGQLLQLADTENPVLSEEDKVVSTIVLACRTLCAAQRDRGAEVAAFTEVTRCSQELERLSQGHVPQDFDFANELGTDDMPEPELEVDVGGATNSSDPSPANFAKSRQMSSSSLATSSSQQQPATKGKAPRSSWTVLQDEVQPEKRRATTLEDAKNLYTQEVIQEKLNNLNQDLKLRLQTCVERKAQIMRMVHVLDKAFETLGPVIATHMCWRVLAAQEGGFASRTAAMRGLHAASLSSGLFDESMTCCFLSEWISDPYWRVERRNHERPIPLEDTLPVMGMTVIKFFNEPDVRWVVTKTDAGDIFVVFATSSWEALSWTQPANVEFDEVSADGGSLRVHHGFLTTVEEIWEELREALVEAGMTDQGLQRLYLCGSGCGGALAKVVLVRLLTQQDPLGSEVSLPKLTGRMTDTREWKVKGWRDSFKASIGPGMEAEDDSPPASARGSPTRSFTASLEAAAALEAKKSRKAAAAASTVSSVPDAEDLDFGSGIMIITFGAPNVIEGAGAADERLQSAMEAYCSPRSCNCVLARDPVPYMLSSRANEVLEQFRWGGGGGVRRVGCCGQRRRKEDSGVMASYLLGSREQVSNYGPLLREDFLDMPRHQQTKGALVKLIAADSHLSPTEARRHQAFDMSVAAFRNYTNALCWRMLGEEYEDLTGLSSRQSQQRLLDRQYSKASIVSFFDVGMYEDGAGTIKPR